MQMMTEMFFNQKDCVESEGKVRLLLDFDLNAANRMLVVLEAMQMELREVRDVLLFRTQESNDETSLEDDEIC